MRPLKITITISFLLGIISCLSYGQKISFNEPIAKKCVASWAECDLKSIAGDATGNIQFSDSTFYIAFYDSAIYDFSYTLTSYNVDSLDNGNQIIEFTGIEQSGGKFKFSCKLLINNNTWEIWFRLDDHTYWYFAGNAKRKI